MMHNNPYAKYYENVSNTARQTNFAGEVSVHRGVFPNANKNLIAAS